jgi:hypothetical protein
VSISPIFYEELFHVKVFGEAFMCSEFEFVIFGGQDIGAKILVNLTPDPQNI